MTEVREKKRKLILVGVTFILCISIMLTGTFAWKSLGQSVINETMGEMTNPGGRLHDDFNGSNKDIYVENFTAGTDGMDIIVRIRLSEYMEIGPDAGTKKDSDDRDVDILTKIDENTPADIEDTSTWNVFSPLDTNNHYGYWSWSMGGQTVYMPTADTDTNSEAVDRNGIYPFDDYKEYEVNEEADDGSGRKAKKTIDGTVMDMRHWIQHVQNGGEMLGDFWVYDGDGWAYWANPLSPQEATGLLLSKITHSRTIEDKWYYGINVECQMVTADEIANLAKAQDKKTGFYYSYGEENDESPSTNARDLLEAIIDEIGYIEVGTYGMYTADISEEELQQLLNEVEETEEKPDTETEETDLEDLTVPNETEAKEENKDETVEEDKEPEDDTDTDASKEDSTTDTDTEETDTPTDGTGNEDAAGDATGGTSDNTAGNPTTGTEGTATDDSNTGDGATGNEPNGENTTVGGETDETNTTEATETGENIEQTSTNPQTAI